MRKVTFGPSRRSHVASWQWLGGEIGDALKSHYRVSHFRGQRNDVTDARRALARSDAVVVIKNTETLVCVLRTRRKYHLFDRAVVFVPVDGIESETQLAKMRKYISMCDLVIAPSLPMLSELSWHKNAVYIDHHLRFWPGDILPYREDGPVLWVGEAKRNLPPLLEWMAIHRPRWELRVLTNHPECLSRAPMFDVRQWSPEEHELGMRECRVAIDVKGADWRQRMKPPTKAMGYAAAGMPIALNEHCSGLTRLRDLGLDVCDPADLDRWMSREYWRETVDCAESVRSVASIGAIAPRWKEAIDATLQ